MKRIKKLRYDEIFQSDTLPLINSDQILTNKINMENTVTMSLEKYDEMKRKIELQNDELRFLGSCDNDGLVKVTCRGSYGNETYEFRDSDNAVNQINKKIQDERDQFKSERDQLKSEFNRVQKTARIALAVCSSLVIYCVFLSLT